MVLSRRLPKRLKSSLAAPRRKGWARVARQVPALENFTDLESAAQRQLDWWTDNRKIRRRVPKQLRMNAIELLGEHSRRRHPPGEPLIQLIADLLCPRRGSARWAKINRAALSMDDDLRGEASGLLLDIALPSRRSPLKKSEIDDRTIALLVAHREYAIPATDEVVDLIEGRLKEPTKAPWWTLVNSIAENFDPPGPGQKLPKGAVTLLTREIETRGGLRWLMSGRAAPRQLAADKRGAYDMDRATARRLLRDSRFLAAWKQRRSVILRRREWEEAQRQARLARGLPDPAPELLAIVRGKIEEMRNKRTAVASEASKQPKRSKVERV